jgi:hypothetical membrane protein
MPRVPWWAVCSAAAAPVLLVGGWSLAAGRQPPGFSSGRDTISALAGLGATDRWVMTAGLAGLGLCHLATAVGLRPAALTGRLLLGVGGAATVLVAVFPVPREGTSVAHQATATIAFLTLTAWPALAGRRSATAPLGLRLPVAACATVALVGLLGWFAVELFTDGTRIGLTERLLAGAQALWPLAVVLSARAGARTMPR